MRLLSKSSNCIYLQANLVSKIFAILKVLQDDRHTRSLLFIVKLATSFKFNVFFMIIFGTFLSVYFSIWDMFLIQTINKYK